MKPVPILLQINRLSLGMEPRVSGVNRADFARHLENAAPPRDRAAQTSPQEHAASRLHSDTQAEPASTPDDRESTPEEGSSATPHAEAEGDPSVAQQTIERASTQPSAALNKTGIVSGRARDLRESTDREFFGHTDLAQLSAQELGTCPVEQPSPGAVASSAAQPLAPSGSSIRSSDFSQSSRADAGAQSESGVGEARPSPSPADQADAGGFGGSGHEQTGDQGPKTQDAAESPPGPDDAGSPRAGSAGSTPTQVGSTQPATHTSLAGAAGTAATLGAKSEPAGVPSPTREVGGIATTSTPGQLLKRLERMPAPVAPTGAEQNGKAEQPVPAAALRGLAAALRQGGGTVTLRLAPETLGQLKVQVSTLDAKVTAKFQTSTEQARQLLTENVEALRSAMESRGLNVEKIVIEHAPGWTTGSSGTSGQEHDERSGGAGKQDVSQSAPWNGNGQGPEQQAGRESQQGQDGHQSGTLGHGRPGSGQDSLRGGGAQQVVAADSAGAISGALTDESGSELIIRLRVDALA